MVCRRQGEVSGKRLKTCWLTISTLLCLRDTNLREMGNQESIGQRTSTTFMTADWSRCREQPQDQSAFDEAWGKR